MNAADVIRPFEILLVEDNPADVRLTRETLKDFNTPNHLSVVRDGVEAIAFLRRQGPYADQTRPDLVLLDINLPRKGGREVLAEIKQDAELRRIPVVILTTSTNDLDIHGAYDLHANCYITKPVDLGHFGEVVKSIENFWFHTVKLPTA